MRLGSLAWRRIFVSGGIIALGAMIDLAINIFTNGLPVGVATGVAMLASIALMWFEHRTVDQIPEDPEPPPAPPLPGWLVARPWETKRITAAVLAGQGVAGLVGSEGFGKTTLAQVVGNDPRVRRKFGNRVYIATFGPDANVTGILKETIQLISGVAPADTDPLAVAEQLAKTLDERPAILLILDDIQSAQQLEPFLRRGKRCVRLVTTRGRDALPAGTRCVSVEAFDPDQARALLIWRLGAPVSPPLVEALLGATKGWPALLHRVNRAIALRIEAGAPADEAAQTVFAAVTADPSLAAAHRLVD